MKLVKSIVIGLLLTIVLLICSAIIVTGINWLQSIIGIISTMLVLLFIIVLMVTTLVYSYQITNKR